ncbi:MAG: glycosyltransferase family A protein [Gemmatimonadota bacterium]
MEDTAIAHFDDPAAGTPPEPPTLAVLVTYHEEGALLREALESLLGQPDGPDVILVHDDASTDPAARHLPDDPRITLLRAPSNVGPAVARNRLAAATTADYVHFHDADDLFLPDWSAVVRDALLEGPDVVLTELSTMGSGGRQVTERLLGLAALERDAVDPVRHALAGAIQPAAGTYRRTVFHAVGGYREALWQSEDLDFHVRLLASRPSLRVIDRPLAVLRLRPEGRSRADALGPWRNAVAAYRLLATELDPTYRPDLAAAAARAAARLYALGDVAAAREAFWLAEELGPPPWAGRGPLYAAVARRWGGLSAERLASAYRRLLPAALRARLRRRTSGG